MAIAAVISIPIAVFKYIDFFRLVVLFINVLSYVSRVTFLYLQKITCENYTLDKVSKISI